jgi:23S rRNA (uracil1939-C5)-methyltransferase
MARLAADTSASEAQREEARKSITPDVVVVDPPRKGCDESLLDTIVKMSPERIVYVSCDSATLARDLGLLAAKGYKTVKVQPVDQFSHTVHVESVAMILKEQPAID